MPNWGGILARGIELMEDGLLDSQDMESVFWDAVDQIDFEELLRNRLMIARRQG